MTHGAPAQQTAGGALTPAPQNPTTVRNTSPQTPIWQAPLRWLGVIVALFLIYGFIQANISGWLKELSVGLALAGALSLACKLVMDHYWHRTASWFMIAWALFMTPLVVMGIHDQVLESIGIKSPEFQTSVELREAQALLNQAARILPEYAGARGAIFDGHVAMSRSLAKKVANRMKEINNFFDTGIGPDKQAYWIPQYRRDFKQVRGWLKEAREIQKEAMEEVQSPDDKALFDWRHVYSNLPPFYWFIVILGLAWVGYKYHWKALAFAAVGVLVASYFLSAAVPDIKHWFDKSTLSFLDADTVMPWLPFLAVVTAVVTYPIFKKKIGG